MRPIRATFARPDRRGSLLVMTGNRPEDAPTIGDPVPSGADAPERSASSMADAGASGEGLETRVLLARAREHLLGWDEDPVRIGRYRVVERIGQGGMGLVYAAHDDELDRPVAIKILRSDLEPGAGGHERLLREAQAIARLSHPNVVHVYEVGHHDGQVFMAMELVRGRTLRRWCRAGERSVAAIVGMYLGAADGLAAAHAAGLVHRDFKPDNVLVGDDGRSRVLDFGLARPDLEGMRTSEAIPTASASVSGSASAASLEVTRTGTVMGTPAYMAPETIAQRRADARSDQYAFAVSLFEALYGTRPFAGSSYTELAEAIVAGRRRDADPRKHGVPRALHAVLLRAMAADPQERFADMHALVAALRRAMEPAPRRWGYGALASLGIAAGALGLALHAGEATWPSSSPEAETVSATAADPWAEIVARTDLPPVVSTPLPGDPTGVTVHRLRNGLTVYLAHHPQAPFVEVQLVVRAGTAAEDAEHRGASFLVLDGVVQGTERLGVLDPIREKPLLVTQHAMLEALADAEDPAARELLVALAAAAHAASAEVLLPFEVGQIEAELGVRESALMHASAGMMIAAEVPRHRLEGWLELTAEAVRRPVFRGVVDSARNALGFYQWMSEGDSAYALVEHELSGGGDGALPIEQTLQNLARVPYREAREYYERWYCPNNMAVVLVGDVTATDVLPVVERHFGDWEPQPVPPIVHGGATEPAQPRVVHAIEDQGPTRLTLAWARPREVVDTVALQAVSTALGGSGNLLTAAMDAPTRLLGTGVRGEGSLDLVVEPGPGQSLEDAEHDVIAALRAVADGGVDDEAWARALAAVELDRHRWARSDVALSRTIVDSFMSGVPWSDVASSLSAPPLTREELADAVARLLLRRNRVVIQQTEGETWRPEIAELPATVIKPKYDQHSEFATRVLHTPVAEVEPRFLVAGSHFEATARGKGRVITSRAESPLFRLTWVYPVGVGHDPWACDAIQAKATALSNPGPRRRAPVLGRRHPHRSRGSGGAVRADLAGARRVAAIHRALRPRRVPPRRGGAALARDGPIPRPRHGSGPCTWPRCTARPG